MQAYIAKTMLLNDKCDYPRVFAIFFSGCNFNCPFCNTRFINSFNEMFSVDLREIKKKIFINSSEVDAVLFTGAEPTLQRQALVELAKYAKSLGLKVCLETNASKPDTIKALLSHSLLDFISISLNYVFENGKFERATKSRTFFAATDGIIKSIKESIDAVKKQNNVVLEFTTLIVPNIMFKKEDLIELGSYIEDINKSIHSIWVLHRFFPANVIDRVYSGIKEPSESFLYDLLEILGKKFPNLDLKLRLSYDKANEELFNSYKEMKEKAENIKDN